MLLKPFMREGLFPLPVTFISTVLSWPFARLDMEDGEKSKEKLESYPVTENWMSVRG